MTGTIWKFLIGPVPVLVFDIPKGANIISAAWDPKTGPCIWVEIPDKTAPKEERKLLVVGTGHALPAERGRFIGTVVEHDSGLVWHIYEEAK